MVGSKDNWKGWTKTWQKIKHVRQRKIDESKTASVQSVYLTSGGDAPGMNAAIRAVVRLHLQKDLR